MGNTPTKQHAFNAAFYRLRRSIHQYDRTRPLDRSLLYILPPEILFEIFLYAVEASPATASALSLVSRHLYVLIYPCMRYYVYLNVANVSCTQLYDLAFDPHNSAPLQSTRMLALRIPDSTPEQTVRNPIPSFIASLCNLTVLKIHIASARRLALDPIYESLVNLTNLKRIEWTIDDLSLRASDWIRDRNRAILAHPGVRHFSATCNGFTSIKQLVHLVQPFPNLKTVNALVHGGSNRALCAFADAMGPCLKSLWIKTRSQQSYPCEFFSGLARNCPDLRELHLHNLNRDEEWRFSDPDISVGIKELGMYCPRLSSLKLCEIPGADEACWYQVMHTMAKRVQVVRIRNAKHCVASETIAPWTDVAAELDARATVFPRLRVLDLGFLRMNPSSALCHVQAPQLLELTCSAQLTWPFFQPHVGYTICTRDISVLSDVDAQPYSKWPLLSRVKLENVHSLTCDKLDMLITGSCQDNRRKLMKSMELISCSWPKAHEIEFAWWIAEHTVELHVDKCQGVSDSLVVNLDGIGNRVLRKATISGIHGSLGKLRRAKRALSSATCGSVAVALVN